MIRIEYKLRNMKKNQQNLIDGLKETIHNENIFDSTRRNADLYGGKNIFKCFLNIIKYEVINIITF